MDSLYQNIQIDVITSLHVNKYFYNYVFYNNSNYINDLIHIDDGHSTEITNSDITNSYRLSKQLIILNTDEYDFVYLHN